MKSLRDSAWQIIIGLVLLAIPSLITWVLPGGWTTVWSYATMLTKWLGASEGLPHWLILILSLCTAVLIALILLCGILKLRQTDDPIQHGEQLLYGILWRWRWTQHGIQHLHAFCPRCDIQVYPISGGIYSITPSTLYECDDPQCQGLRKEFHGQNPSEVENLVIRKIQQQFRHELRNTKSRET